MPASELRSFLMTAVLMLAVGAAAPVTTTRAQSLLQAESELERRLSAAENAGDSAADELQSVLNHLAHNSPGIDGLLSAATIDRISYFLLDSDRSTRHAAMNILRVLGPAARPAAKRAARAIEETCGGRIECSFAWRVRVAIAGDYLPVYVMIRERIALIPGVSEREAARLAREVKALVSFGDLQTRIRTPDQLGSDLARIVEDRVGGLAAQYNIAQALGHLGPRAAAARTALERAVRAEQSRDQQCISGPCGVVLEAYRRALSCVTMSDEAWRFDGWERCRAADKHE